ncbi:MAG: anti-sigma factor domain-containing protein [Pyrinomonadaceae bacterium]
MTHEDYKELLAANSLSALDAEDSRELEAHLEECADCRSEVNEWQRTAAFLALSSSPLEPSLKLRERILASIPTERADGKLTAEKADIHGEPPTSSDSKILPFERQRKSVWASGGSLGAIAAALVFAALIVSLVALWQKNRASQIELARLSTEAQEAKEQLAHEREVIELLTSPGARMQELAGTNVAPGAHAMLAYDKTGHAMMMAKGLPAAPKGMAYQLWFIVGKKPMPGKVFTTDGSGNGSLKDQLPEPALGPVVFAITLEPESGMQSPTGAIYLSSTS